MLGPVVSRTVCLLVALTVLAPFVVSQQHPGPMIELITDPGGDIRSSGPAGAVIPTQSPAVDVRMVRLQDLGDSLRFEFVTSESDGRGTDTTKSTLGFKVEDASTGQVADVELRALTGTEVGSDFFQVWVDGVQVSEGPASYSGFPWDYTANVGRNLFTDDEFGVGDRIFEAYALVQDPAASPFALSDRAPDSGFGQEHVSDRGPSELVEHAASHAANIAWRTIQGPDFAGGPSIAVGSDDQVHVAYVVYNDDRQTAKGLYHGVIDGSSITSERIGDATMPTELHEDANTQTAIDVDEKQRVHIAYHPHPNATAADAVRYARLENGAWTIEDPAALATQTLTVEDGYRAIPNVVARGDKVVVAFQESIDKFALVRRAPSGSWGLIEEIEGRFPRLALDSGSNLHVAWFRQIRDESPNRPSFGDLVYRDFGGSQGEQVIAQDIYDQSRFWESSETDGSFAFALGPGDTPHFVWEEINQDARHYGILSGTTVDTTKSPLTPNHGNPQLRMRMAIDPDGNSHVVSGYGGSDLYGMRGRNGGWAVEAIERGDMFSMDILGDGRVVMAYTEPHGGTTLAIDIADHRPGSPPVQAEDEASDPEEPATFPGTPVIPGPGIAIGILGGVGAASWVWLRGIDTAPRLFGASVAAIAGFSRLKKNELLDHETREEIVEAITSSPGRTAASVRKDLGLSRTTFFYHLRRLEQEGLVRIARRGAQLYLETPAIFAGRVEPATVEARIFRAAVEAPGMAAGDYASMLQLHERTVRHHLLSLERRGELRSERASARNVHWFGGAGRGQN